jgi:transcriptional regulator with XRE-family HTH domain
MDSDVKKLIGNRIRSIRNEKAWSQEELAHRADLHPSHMGQIERGEKSFTIDSLEKVVNALDISFEELFRFVNPDFKDKDTSVVFGITNKLIKRSVKDQKAIAKLIDGLLGWKDK